MSWILWYLSCLSGSSGEAARVATARKTLLLCSAALHLPSHPPICLCVFTRKNKTCWTNPPCLCPHYSDFWIYFFLSVCWGVFTGYCYHPNYFFSFSAVSIQHFLFAFLIRLSVCFCLFSVAFQLLHLTRFGFFFLQHLVLTAYLTLYYTPLLSHIGHCYLYPSLDLNQDEFQMSSNCFWNIFQFSSVDLPYIIIKSW